VEIAKKGGCPEDHLGIKNRIKKIPVDGCVITFLDNFTFFWVPSMKNINLKYFKDLMVKVCKIWCNNVY
jgi:hypothetical protein